MGKVDIFMNFALELAQLSKCTKRKVASVVTSADLQQVYSIGLNGGAIKGLDCLCTLGSKYGCLHSEAQSIAKCTTADKHKVMFVTLSPCVMCATMIINTGFTTVYYREKWKDEAGLQLLINAGLHVVQI